MKGEWSQIYPPLDPYWPLAPASAIRCGNDVNVPKKSRVHEFNHAGIETRRDIQTGKIGSFEVIICVKCGMDKQKAF